MDTPSPPSPDLNDPAVVGLARRIYWRRFSERVAAAGVDPDDGMQEVLMGLLTRSRSVRSRWDPTRGALSTWIFVATSGLVINLADKSRRRAAHEVGVEEATEAESLASHAAVISAMDIRDLAAEMEIPAAVVVALVHGGDPLLAAMDSGMGVREADALCRALGHR